MAKIERSSGRGVESTCATGRTSRIRRRTISLAAASLLLLPLGLVGGTTAASAAGPGPVTCTGSTASPGTLAGGTYSSVGVTGVCYVDAGQVVVTGSVTVATGAALGCGFAKDKGAAGTSGLTVDGNIAVAAGATLVLGCEAPEYPCLDDDPGAPTLHSSSTVKGSVVATDPLGVIIHDASIGGDATQSGGGGGRPVPRRPRGSSRRSTLPSTATTRTTPSAGTCGSPASPRAGSVPCVTVWPGASPSPAIRWPTPTPWRPSATGSPATCCARATHPPSTTGTRAEPPMSSGASPPGSAPSVCASPIRPRPARSRPSPSRVLHRRATRWWPGTGACSPSVSRSSVPAPVWP